MEDNLKRDSVVIYRSWYEYLSLIDNDKEFRDCVNCLFEYAFDNTHNPNYCKQAEFFYVAFQPQMDKNNIRYLNGLRGGAPTKELRSNPLYINATREQKRLIHRYHKAFNNINDNEIDTIISLSNDFEFTEILNAFVKAEEHQDDEPLKNPIKYIKKCLENNDPLLKKL